MTYMIDLTTAWLAAVILVPLVAAGGTIALIAFTVRRQLSDASRRCRRDE